MAIDIRAEVTCSLGVLITGSISDDYVQGSGLVKTRGSCEIKGLLTPEPGSVVTFSYTRDAVTTQVPRQLLVLSSFADPFRQTTKVELGCRLTFMENASPGPAVPDANDPTGSGSPSATSGRQQQCINGYEDYPNQSPGSGSSLAGLPIPVYAEYVMETCLERLGLTATSNPLTNRFFVDEFDLSAGYVSVLGDLLVSEGYFGHIDKDGVLQVKELNTEGGTGPLIDSTSIVDIGAIGVGELSADAVVIRLRAVKLKKNATEEEYDERQEELANWELEEQTGDTQLIYINYTDLESGEPATAVYEFTPFSQTRTEYGEDNSFDDDVCILYSSQGEGLDLSNKVVKRTRTDRVSLAQVAGNYCSELLSIGIEVNGNLVGEVVTVTTYEYDEEGELAKETTVSDEPIWKWAGGLNIPFAYGEGNYVIFGTETVTTEKSTTKYTTLRRQGDGGEFVSGQKIVNTTYKNFALTLGGQQVIASRRDFAPIESSNEAADYFLYLKEILVLDDQTVQTSRNRVLRAAESRPSSSERLRSDQSRESTDTTTDSTAISSTRGIDTDEYTEIIYVIGSSNDLRKLELSMPYQCDDVYGTNGIIIKSDAAEKAMAYGRVQNRLLLGNRAGANLQLALDKMPSYPMDSLFLSDGNLTVLYKANGINWAFDSNGIVGSVDALYWGVAGGTGTPWVPVAPGVTTFPAAPVPNGQNQVTVGAVVPPLNETLRFQGVTYSKLIATSYSYIIGVLDTTAVTLTTKAKLLYVIELDASSAAFTSTGQSAALKYNRAVKASAGAFTLSGFGSGFVRDYVIGTNAGTFATAGQAAALVYQRSALAAEAGAFTLSGQDAAGFLGKTLSAGSGSFTLSGQSAGLIRPDRVLTASDGTFTATGQAAQFQYVQPLFSVVTYSGNGSTQSISSGFKPGLLWLKKTSSGTPTGNFIFDKVRGATKYWGTGAFIGSESETTDANSVSSLDTSGFSLGTATRVNASSTDYVAFAWKEGGTASSNTNGDITSTVSVNNDLGYSVFTYTGNGLNGNTIGHGLSAEPELVIIKRLNDTGYTPVVGSDLVGINYFMDLSATDAATDIVYFYGSANSTTVTVGSNNPVNANGSNYVGYAFTSVPGVSKIGVYTGGGTATITQSIGFTPKFVLVRNYNSSGGDWMLNYLTSGTTGYTTYVTANGYDNASTSTKFQFVSNGFSVDTGGPGNVSGGTTSAIYMAFA